MKQTQGTWNPNERCIYFFAGDFGYRRVAKDNAWKLVNRYDNRFYNLFAVNNFADVGKPIDKDKEAYRQFVISIEQGCPTFLDSGIFFLTNVHKRTNNTTMDEALALAPEEIDNFEWLFETYCLIVDEFGERLWGYNELDQGGMENKKRTRANLESLGYAPIPVYHPLNDGWDYFDELAQEYDRICFGNVVQARPSVRKRLLATAFERHAKYPDLFIHFLGLTPNDLQMGLPFDSCDSSSWTAPFRFPQAVRLTGAGAKRWKLRENWYLPFASDGQTLEQSIDSGNMTCLDYWCASESMRHYNYRKQEHFNMPMYQNGEMYGEK